MLDASRFQRIVIERYCYRGFHGCECFCDLEILHPSSDIFVAIVTERKDNPGTSITNICEHLAYWVCVEFEIDPSSLVWIEYYVFPSAINPNAPRTYDLVTFDLLPPGHDAVFAHPRWRPMKPEDWERLGLSERK